MIDVGIGDARALGGQLDAELQFSVIQTDDGWFGVATVRTADGTSYSSDVDPEGDVPSVRWLNNQLRGVYSPRTPGKSKAR